MNRTSPSFLYYTVVLSTKNHSTILESHVLASSHSEAHAWTSDVPVPSRSHNETHTTVRRGSRAARFLLHCSGHRWHFPWHSRAPCHSGQGSTSWSCVSLSRRCRQKGAQRRSWSALGLAIATGRRRESPRCRNRSTGRPWSARRRNEAVAEVAEAAAVAVAAAAAMGAAAET